VEEKSGGLDLQVSSQLGCCQLYHNQTKDVQGDQKVSVHLMITVKKNSVYSNIPHTIDDLKMAIAEYIRNVGRAILNTVFENTFRHVDKCL
jgi:hypothetical protein